MAPRDRVAGSAIRMREVAISLGSSAIVFPPRLSLGRSAQGVGDWCTFVLSALVFEPANRRQDIDQWREHQDSRKRTLEGHRRARLAGCLATVS